MSSNNTPNSSTNGQQPEQNQPFSSLLHNIVISSSNTRESLNNTQAGSASSVVDNSATAGPSTTPNTAAGNNSNNIVDDENTNNESPFGFDISLTEDFNTLSPFGRILASFVMMSGGREQRKKHASQAALDNLKHIDIHTLPESDRNCSICFEPFAEYKEEDEEKDKDREDHSTEESGKMKHSIVNCTDESSTVEVVDYSPTDINLANEDFNLDDQLFGDTENPPLLMPLSADAGRVGVRTPRLDPIYRRRIEEKKKKKKDTKKELSHCARQLPCGHTFGEACIFQWLKNDVTCPLCRKPVEAADEGSSGENSTTGGRTMIIYSYPLTRVFINADQSRAGESHNPDDPHIAMPEANYDGGSFSGNSVIPDEAYAAQEDFLRSFNNNNNNNNNDDDNNNDDENTNSNASNQSDTTSANTSINTNSTTNINNEDNDITMTSANEQTQRRSVSSDSFRSRRIDNLPSSSYNRRSRLMPDRRAIALFSRAGRTGGPARRSIIPRTSLLNPYGRGFMVTFSNIRNTAVPTDSNASTAAASADLSSTRSSSSSNSIGNTTTFNEDTVNEAS